MAEIATVVRVVNNWKRCAVAGMLLVLGSACVMDDPTLIVYTSLPGDFVEEVGRSFEAANPEADVRFVKLDDGTALAQLTKERGGDQTDVWWGASADVLDQAAAAELLAGPWTATMASPLVLAFHQDRVSLGRAPMDWRDLLHPRWRDELTLLDPEVNPETRAFLFGFMVQEARRTGVLDAGFDWLLRLDAATGLYVADMAALETLFRSGEALLTILPLHLAKELEEGSVVSWRVPESGSPALVRGVGVVAGTSQPELASAFAEHVTGTGVAPSAVETIGWVMMSSESMPRAGGDERLAGLRLWATAPDTVSAEGEGWMRHWTQEIRGRGAPTIR